MSRETPDKLPQDWLPDPVGRSGEQDPTEWDERLRSLMTAAAPRLAELQHVPPPWWEVLGTWWKPITGATAAATAALVVLLVFPSPDPGAPLSGTLALRAVVTEGEPALLWAGLGEEADPVLAFIVLEGETP